MKKNFKRFFTLKHKSNDGFTLVELIVVIAILAILGGVAVPAYSGYVKKANMQADISLMSDIEYALTLAGYSGALPQGTTGYIILSANDAVEGIEAGSDLENALIATFGTGYADMMKLSHDEWGSNGLFDDMTTMDALYVAGSSYMTGQRKEVLLSDVEKMTGMAQNLVSSLASGGGAAEGTTLSGLFGENVLNETAKKYGVTLAEGQTWEEWGAIEENKTAYGNLLVLTAADEMNKKKNDPTYEMSTASNMITEFSSYYAFAATNPVFSAQLDEYMNQLNDGKTVTSVATGKDWYVNLENAAKANGYDDYKSTVDDRNQATTDQLAFQSIMAGLGNPTEEQATNIAADLNNANLFTEGVVNNMYNDYLDAVDVMVGEYIVNPSGQGISVGDGEVAVLFVAKNGEVSVSNSLPKN